MYDVILILSYFHKVSTSSFEDEISKGIDNVTLQKLVGQTRAKREG